MFGLPYAQEMAVSAGICSGAALGVFLTTGTEGKKRGLSVSVNPFERIPIVDAVKTIALTIGALLVIGGPVILMGLGVLRLGGVHHLTSDLRRSFALAFLAGAAAGKLFRYYFWQLR